MEHRLAVAACLLVVALSGCEAAAALGTPCGTTSDCASPLVCRLGRCRSECVANRDCPLGARCLLDRESAGSCSLDVDDACRAGECPAPTLCIEGACRNLCGGTTLCPEGNECVTSPLGEYCIAPDLPDAGPPGDAGDPGDAGLRSAPVVDACRGIKHVCAATTTSGHVHCWGADDQDMFGDGPSPHGSCTSLAGADCSIVPVSVQREDDGALLAGAVQVGCGNDHTCARLGNGEVYCWGRAYAVGTDDHVGRDPVRAVRVELSGAASEIVVAAAHACAHVGRDWECWGENGHGGVVDGRLGDPSFTDEVAQIPRVIPAFRDAVQIGVASRATCAVNGAQVACVGSNDSGQLGAPQDGLPHAAPPTTVILPSAVTGIVGGNAHFCAIASGLAMCWGQNSRCELGRTTTGGEETPMSASTTEWRALASGIESETVCGIRAADGTVACWGDNTYGQSGLETPPGFVCAPNSILRADGTPLVAERLLAACAITATGELWCWSANDAGTLQLAPSADLHPRAIRLTVPE